MNAGMRHSRPPASRDANRRSAGSSVARSSNCRPVQSPQRTCPELGLSVRHPKMPRNRAALTQPWPLVNQNAPADEFLGNCRRTNPESFAGRTRVGMAAASMVSEPQRRALRLLASSADGVTEALLLANGVSIDVMVEIINAGLAVAHVQQLARPRIEV